jgi:hypothetical protein
MTLTIPAKLHPEVVIQAVAARSRTRAEEFAKKNGIPEVKDSYQGKSCVYTSPSWPKSSLITILTLFPSSSSP